METKNLLARSIEEISAEELSDLQLVITRELDHRHSRAKETAWNKVVDTIKDYITTFGCIEIETDDSIFFLTMCDCYSENGHITIGQEEN